MQTQKSLMTELCETIDRHRAERRKINSAQSPTRLIRPGWLRWVARQLAPNLGSVVLVLILLYAFPGIAAPLRAPTATSISTIPYQGRLADAGGTPITAKQNMEFRVYDAPVSGTPLWEEFWTGGNSVNVSDGLFSVMLGSINTGLASVVQGYDELYLSITIGTDSEMEPRVQLGSVPFSMWSMTVADDSITSEKIADNAVGSSEIISGSISTDEIVDGTVASIDLAPNAVTTANIVDGAITSTKLDLQNGLEVSGTTTLMGPVVFQTWEQVTALGNTDATATCPSGKTIVFGWKLHMTDNGQADKTSWGDCLTGASSCSISGPNTVGDDEVRVWIVCQ
ncbi:MAG: hypothetical protein GY832_05235 [Chloroflexi bacterium]|nr:hypothetical protein [Chloroflexota bacterium]